MRNRPRRHGQTGQALVETALVLPIFLLIVFGLIDGGRLVYSNSVVSQAARDGARAAAAEVAWVGITTSTDPSCVTSHSGIGPGNPGAHVCPPSLGSMHSDVVAAVNRMAATTGTINAVYIDCRSAGSPAPTGDWTGNGCAGSSGGAMATKGDIVSVRVVYTYRAITPFFNAVPALKAITVTGAASMVVD